MAIFADFLSGNGAWFGEQRVGFWSSFDGPGFDATGPVADLLLSDQDKQAMELLVVLGAGVSMPGDPDLHGVFEAELAR